MENSKGLLAHKRKAHHTMSCVVCGLSFTRCDNFKRHIRTHQDQNCEGIEKTTDQIKPQITELCCELCGYKTNKNVNLKRHMRKKHTVNVRKKKTSRQKKYRERLRFMKNVENTNFAKRMAANGQQPLIDTDIEQIMAARPNMSNRDVAAFLRIIKKKLPAKTGKGGFAIMVVIEMVVTNRMTKRCTGWERPKALMLDFVFFQGEAPLKFQTNCVSPPDFFLLRSRTIFDLKKAPLKKRSD